MSLYLGTQLLAGVATNTISNAHDLFDFKWTDHLLTDMSWLRADTFSWQDGTVYTEVYNHLVADYNGGTSQTETVGSYTITYVLATDGHKITTDETNVANIYNESGVAWYYILDTANQRFKLPRENPAREELIQVVRAKGNGNGLGVTNGYNTGMMVYSTATVRHFNGSSSSQAQAVGTYNNSNFTDSNDFTVTGIVSDSTKSGIISDMTDSTSVFKGKNYLYFYVGQYSQTATEQTAGLNSELFNGKVDLNAANLSTQGKSLISGLGMPSNRYIDLTPGASGTKYNMQANGYLCIGVTHPDNTNLEAIGVDVLDSNDVFLFNVGGAYNLNNQSYWFLVPVQNGFKVQVWSNGFSITRLRFIYAQGEINV